MREMDYCHKNTSCKKEEKKIQFNGIYSETDFHIPYNWRVKTVYPSLDLDRRKSSVSILNKCTEIQSIKPSPYEKHGVKDKPQCRSQSTSEQRGRVVRVGP